MVTRKREYIRCIDHRLLCLVIIGFLLYATSWAQGIHADGKAYTIGLLVNDSNELEATYSAEYLVKKINKDGGIHGRTIDLVTRSVEGSWGTGSNEVVKMVFEDEVTIVLGAIDGRNSHLAEQVIAKTQVLYVSAWSSDPTLTQAYVPYYFSVVPTDEQQADHIIKQMSYNQDEGKCLVIYDTSYDASQALISMRSAYDPSKEHSMKAYKVSAAGDMIGLKNQIQRDQYTSYVLVGKELPLSEIMSLLQELKSSSPVYVNLQAMSSPEFNSIAAKDESQMIKNYLSLVINDEFESLSAEFRIENGTDAGLISAQVYDGMKIIFEALNRSGSHQETLKASLAKTKYQGVTGEIQFDANGKLRIVPVP